MAEYTKTKLTTTGKKVFLDNLQYRLGDVIDIFKDQMSAEENKKILAAMEVVSELMTSHA